MHLIELSLSRSADGLTNDLDKSADEMSIDYLARDDSGPSYTGRAPCTFVDPTAVCRSRWLLARPTVLYRRFDAVALGFARGRLFFRRVALPFTCSGSFCPPVSRFHSSNVLFEIFPSTRSSANFRRCAWLLNGIAAYDTSIN